MGVAPRAGGAGVGSTSGTHRPTTWAAAARGDRSTGWLRWDRFGPDPTAGAGPGGVVFNNLGWGEITTLFAIALIVFGPERLPKVAADAGRMIRELRKMAIGLTDKLKAELGPEIGDLDLASLHPKRLMEKALLDEDGNESAATAGPGSGAPTPGLRPQPRGQRSRRGRADSACRAIVRSRPGRRAPTRRRPAPGRISPPRRTPGPPSRRTRCRPRRAAPSP